MTIKTLLFMNERLLKPTGGPVGYLYNLKKVIDENEISSIEFITDYNKKNNFLKSIIMRIIGNKNKQLIINNILVNSIYKNKSAKKIDLSEYDIVHFHTTNSLFMNRENVKNFKGKVLLTTHSPKPAHLEIIENQLSKKERLYYRKKLKSIEKIDDYAFHRADYIIFPCEDAEEPYLNNWSKFKTIKKNNANKFKYIPTGCNKCEAKKTKEEILKHWNIPAGSFVISYVGRHNETKGYDQLKLIGEKLLRENDNIYFLIAGLEAPLTRLKHERWIEVGWTNDPHSLINASDMFILPNKETYFDLIMLEVLSMGKIVLATNTGGNKYFKRFDKRGIFYYENLDEAINIILKISNLTAEKKKELEKCNLDIYNANFTMKIFLQNYLKILDEICGV